MCPCFGPLQAFVPLPSFPLLSLAVLALLSVSISPTFLLSLGRLGAGLGPGPTAADLLGLSKMPQQSDGGLSRSLVLGPLVSCGGCLYVQVPQTLFPSQSGLFGAGEDEAGSICPCKQSKLPVQGNCSSKCPPCSPPPYVGTPMEAGG